jgi:hypothetical protein
LVKWLPDWCDLKPDGTFYRLSDLAMTNPIALKMAHPAELAQFVPLAFAVGRIFFLFRCKSKCHLGLGRFVPLRLRAIALNLA